MFITLLKKKVNVLEVSARNKTKSIIISFDFIFSIHLEFFSCVAEIVYGVSVSLQIKYSITGRRAGDVAAMCACPKKAEAELGWKAKYTLADMCK